MSELGAPDFDRLLEDARRTLETMRSGGPHPAGDEEPIHGTGESADGRITAVVTTGGELESLQMDPRALRMGSEELCEQIVIAVNAALADLRTKAGAQAAVLTAGDPTVLNDRLRELQDQSMRQMTMFTQAINDTLTRLSRRD